MFPQPEKFIKYRDSGFIDDSSMRHENALTNLMRQEVEVLAIGSGISFHRKWVFDVGPELIP